MNKEYFAEEKNTKISNFSINQQKKLYYLAALASLLSGITIYAVFRNLDIVLFKIFPRPYALDILNFPVKTNSKLFNVFIYNFPDGLWCLSGLLVIRGIWLTNLKWRVFYCAVFITSISSLELSQLNNNVPGTFDIFDLVSYGISLFTESIIFNLFIKRNIQK